MPELVVYMNTIRTGRRRIGNFTTNVVHGIAADAAYWIWLWQADPAAAGSHKLAIAHTPCGVVSHELASNVRLYLPLTHNSGATPELDVICQFLHTVWYGSASRIFDFEL